jgi:hypothetical protein
MKSVVQTKRALVRLAQPGAALLAISANAYGVFPRGDRRRRPLARLGGADVRALEASGAIAAAGQGGFALTEAGRASLRRDAAADPAESYLHQHAEIGAKSVIEADGAVREVRAAHGGGALKRLRALRGADGSPWLSHEELAAAVRLQEDWALGQTGLIGGSDWSAPPRGAAARGPGNAREGAMAAQIDARARLAGALEALAPALRRVVERACLHEEGLEALERAENWPARSGKIALKLGLAQLAQMRR